MHTYRSVKHTHTHSWWNQWLNACLIFLSGCVHAANPQSLIHVDLFWPSPCWRGPWFLIDPWLVAGTWTGHKTPIKWPHNKRSPKPAPCPLGRAKSKFHVTPFYMTIRNWFWKVSNLFRHTTDYVTTTSFIYHCWYLYLSCHLSIYLSNQI